MRKGPGMSLVNHMMAAAKQKPAELLLPRLRMDDFIAEIARRYAATPFVEDYVRVNLLLGRMKLLGVPVRVAEDHQITDPCT
jgi:hypothetical protein